MRLNTAIRVYIEDIDRKLDITQIQQVMLATNKLGHEVEVYLDNIRFENVLPPTPTEPFSFSFEKYII